MEMPHVRGSNQHEFLWSKPCGSEDTTAVTRLHSSILLWCNPFSIKLEIVNQTKRR